jgi:dTDP-4-dehydrorhamnose reductase
VRSLIEKERPGAIFYVSYDRVDRAVTVDGARAAARAASSIGARFLYVSTDLVFDGRSGNYNETMSATPIMTYGRLKIEAESSVRDAAPGAVVLRPSLMVGESGIIMQPLFECGNLMRGQTTQLYSDEWRSPVHVDDVARAAWDLISGDASGRWHVGGPEKLSRLELGKLLCSMFRFDPKLIVEAKRPDDRPRDTSLDSRRLTEFLGWAPRRLSTLAKPAMAASA